jgi:hypothetical protein
MRNISLAFTLSVALTAVGCGGTENAASNSTANSVLVNAFNATPVANSQIEMANTARSLNANGQNPAVTGNVKPLVQTAPENSEFTMTLTDVGIETRTFKSHPKLDKVVKTVKPGSSSIKIYLKNGKVVEVAGDKIQALKTASTTVILAAAGIKPPPPSPPTAAADGTQDTDPSAPTKKP